MLMICLFSVAVLQQTEGNHHQRPVARETDCDGPVLRQPHGRRRQDFADKKSGQVGDPRVFVNY